MKYLIIRTADKGYHSRFASDGESESTIRASLGPKDNLLYTGNIEPGDMETVIGAVAAVNKDPSKGTIAKINLDRILGYTS